MAAKKRKSQQPHAQRKQRKRKRRRQRSTVERRHPSASEIADHCRQHLDSDPRLPTTSNADAAHCGNEHPDPGSLGTQGAESAARDLGAGEARIDWALALADVPVDDVFEGLNLDDPGDLSESRWPSCRTWCRCRPPTGRSLPS